MAIPEAKIENDKFVWHAEFIECYKWTCPTCGEVNYGPAYDRAAIMYIRHAKQAHPEQVS